MLNLTLAFYLAPVPQSHSQKGSNTVGTITNFLKQITYSTSTSSHNQHNAGRSLLQVLFETWLFLLGKKSTVQQALQP
jgi:hypothetical protein